MPPRPALSSIDLSALANSLDAAPSPLPSRHRASEPDPTVHDDPEEEEGLDGGDDGEGYDDAEDDGEGSPFDFGDDSEDAPPGTLTRPQNPQPEPDSRWAFEAKPRGEAVAGYGAFQGGAAEVSPPIWPGHKRYPTGSTTIMVQRVNPVSGRREELGTLPGDATTLTLLRKFKRHGDYILTPMDESGEQLIAQPIVRAIGPSHDAFQRIASEDSTAEAITGGSTMSLASMRSIGGGDLAVINLMRDNLVAERTERQLHQTKAETAAERVVRAHELSTNRVLTELDKLNAARVDVERTLGTAQTNMLREQNALQTQLQERLMADQAKAYEKMAEAHKALGEEQARLARESAIRTENLAKEQAAAAAASGNNVMTMMMAFMQANQARAEQELARQQAQLALEAQRQRESAELARLEQARVAQIESERRAQEREDREAQRAAEREERRLRMEEEEARRRAEEAERKRLRDELEGEERKALRRREEERERREEERERREASMEQLKMEMMAKVKPADPAAWLTTTTMALGALAKFAPVVRDLFGGGREEAEEKPTGWVDVLSQAMQALPVLVQARTQQMQLEMSAAQGEELDDADTDDDNPEDEEEEEDVPPKGFAYQPPKPRLPVSAPAAPPAAQTDGPPTPPFPAQRRVREALQGIARAVERDPTLDMAGVQGLITKSVIPIAGEFLQFAQWRGSLSATVAEGHPNPEANARIMAALAAYTGPGSDFLKRLPT